MIKEDIKKLTEKIDDVEEKLAAFANNDESSWDEFYPLEKEVYEIEEELSELQERFDRISMKSDNFDELDREQNQIDKLIKRIQKIKKEYDFYDEDSELDAMFPDGDDDD